MTTDVQELTTAVAHLPKPQLTAFRSWFQSFDDELWDKQIAADAKSGALDQLADQALSDLAAGKCMAL